MSRELVAGRTALKRTFREFFVRLFDDGRDTRSFLSFRKQREMPAAPPWMFLFHGDACLGKTTAINYCLALADEVAQESKKTVNTITLDWEEWGYVKGDVPSDRMELMDAITELFGESKNELSGNFEPYRKLNENYRNIMQQIRKLLADHRLERALETDQKHIDEAEELELFPSSLRPMLSAEEIDLYENGENKLAELLVRGILGSAEEVPLILSIDSYDHIAPELEHWFRTTILKPLAERRTGLILFLGAKSSMLRYFRNDFAEENLYAVNFSDIPLTRHTISLMASKMHVTLADGDAELIEKATAGIPFLVYDVLFYAAQNIPVATFVENAENDIHAAESLCGAILDRFFTRCADVTTRERIFSLVMFPQFNAKAFAEVWNVQFADVKNTIGELEKQVSFIRNRHPHPHIRQLLRSSLIQEASRGEKSELKTFFTGFSASTTRIFRELLTQLQTAVPVAEKRCHDPRYTITIEQLVSGLMWSSPVDALLELPGFYLELIHFNQPAAQKLLARAAEFRPLFSSDDEQLFKQFIRCLRLSDKSAVLNRLAVDAAEEKLMVYFDGVAESMNDFHRALFYHVKGTLELRKNNLKEAMEQFDRCFSLLGNGAPEKTILYEDYVVLGGEFNRTQEHRNAVKTFSNAVLIKADGFTPWYVMGLSRMALGEFEGAINAFSESVKIDPNHADAWFNLGLSHLRESQPDKAVTALLNATGAAPERPEFWFELGSAYRSLGRHTEAVSSFRKVVLAQDDNADAWVLLGHSCSAAGVSDDAIVSYRKAIEIKPKSLEPLKALGLEFLNRRQFDEAIDSFTKATRINKKDAELWCLIAEAHLGSGQADHAIEAGETALSINQNFARAWIAIGNARMSADNLDDAIAAFLKSVEIEPENAEIWQKLGTIYSSRQEHEAAIAAFKKAVAFNPDLKEVWYTIGMAYETQKQHAEAIAAYEKGTQVDPNNTDCWFHKGCMHQILEQFDDAFECFSRVITLNDVHLDGWFRRGEMASRMERHDEAAVSFSRVVEIDQASAEGWFRLGGAHLGTGNYQEAIRCFSTAASHDAARTDIRLALGDACQTVGDYGQAIAVYEQCIAIDPQNPLYHAKAGNCQYAVGSYDNAYIALKHATDLDPENTDTLYQLALTCHAQENYSESIGYYKTITARKEDHQDAWFNLALAYHAVQDYSNAVAIYHECLRKWPDNGPAWFNLGLAYHAAEDLENAILTYKEATHVTPNDPEVWYHLGMALHATEHYGDAIQAYRKVLQFVPDHINAWFNLGMAYYIWQNYSDAADAYTNVVKRDPGHYTAWGNLAIVRFANDDYIKGAEAARKAFDIKSDEPWLLGNMVVGTLFTGSTLKAQEFAEQLMVLEPSGATAAQVACQIRNSLKKLPQTEGADAVLQRLSGEVVPMPEQPVETVAAE